MSGLLLEQVLHEGLWQERDCMPQTPEYADTVELRDTVEGELRGQFSPTAAGLFETFLEYVEKLTALQNEACYIRGLSTGIRLAAEAYTLDEIRHHQEGSC
ncbi:MAG: hypothetical protein LUF30_07505 [Lachnospiraceae bacterium]|nr:hypothetical protein [Lachnospiraceae bacterium]